MIEIVFFDERADGVTLIPLVLDASPEQLHRASAVVTDHEVERGVAIADHLRPEPRVLTVNVVISETPLDESGGVSETRLQDEWRKLLDARDRALLATVTTRLETYEDMVLIEAAAPQTAERSLRAELTFKQLRIVSTELVADPVALAPRNRRQVNRGAQGTTEATERQRSVLLRGGQAAGWFD